MKDRNTKETATIPQPKPEPKSDTQEQINPKEKATLTSPEKRAKENRANQGKRP
jgi:hypothetical protein